MPDHPTDISIARATQAARNAPADPAMWLKLATSLRQAERRDDEARVLDEALARIPNDARLNFAAGICALHGSRHDQARHRLARAAELDPASAAPWLALARAAEAAGDLPLMLAHCGEAVRRDARHLRALLDMGIALFRRRQLDLALTAFRRATEAQPGSAEAWFNLAAVRARSGPVADALAAADCALALDPGVAKFHGLRGDVLRLSGRQDEAASSYATAVRLRPDSPELLNKLGCAQRQTMDVTGAEALFRRAVAQSPAFGPARDNLIALLSSQRRLAEGRALLQQLLANPALDPRVRREVAGELAVLDEHERLFPAIAESVARESDTPILRLVSAIDDAALRFNAQKIALLENIAHNIPRAATNPERFARIEPEWPGWPALEAHFSLHLGDEPDAILRSVGVLATGPNAAADEGAKAAARDLQRQVRAVQCRRVLAAPEAHGAAWEARLRFWHAMLTWEHPELYPGRIKPAPNIVSMNPTTPRARPSEVAGTLRRLFTGPYRRVPPGPWRAALVYFAIADIHCFANGNGRLARFLTNLELERAGFAHIVLTDRASKTIGAALAGVRVLGDLEPLVELFARAGAETTDLIRTLRSSDTAPR